MLSLFSHRHTKSITAGKNKTNQLIEENLLNLMSVVVRVLYRPPLG